MEVTATNPDAIAKSPAALSLALEVLKSSRRDLDATRAALASLCTVSVSADRLQSMIDAQAHKAVIRALQDHPSDGLVQEIGTAVLSNMALHSHTGPALMEAGVGALLIDGLRDASNLQLSGCRVTALANLANCADNDVRHTLYSLGVVPACMALTQSPDLSLRGHAILCLANMVIAAALRPLLVRDGVHAALCDALRDGLAKGGEDDETKAAQQLAVENALAGLAKLSFSRHKADIEQLPDLFPLMLEAMCSYPGAKQVQTCGSAIALALPALRRKHVALIVSMHARLVPAFAACLARGDLTAVQCLSGFLGVALDTPIRFPGFDSPMLPLACACRLGHTQIVGYLSQQPEAMLSRAECEALCAELAAGNSDQQACIPMIQAALLANSQADAYSVHFAKALGFLLFLAVGLLLGTLLRMRDASMAGGRLHASSSAAASAVSSAAAETFASHMGWTKPSGGESGGSGDTM
eukprot:m.79042 g.79042  ORF g.79042 m.79042 type:complete len:470 (-) comp14774_c0_seq1:362-1771(-)